MADRLQGFYAIIDPYSDPTRSYESIGMAFVDASCRIIQLRVKDRSLEQARRITESVRAIIPRDRLFILNDYVDLAIEVGADGVHIGQEDMPPAEARKRIGPDRVLGWSTHNLAQVRAAESQPVDYIGFGPIYSTRSKPNPDPETGAALLREAVRLSSKPIVAIGGITLENLQPVLDAGPAMVASIAGVISPGVDLSSRAREWRDRLGE